MTVALVIMAALAAYLAVGYVAFRVMTWLELRAYGRRGNYRWATVAWPGVAVLVVAIAIVCGAFWLFDQAGRAIKGMKGGL